MKRMPLTEREQYVYDRVCQGHSDTEIARGLHLSKPYLRDIIVSVSTKIGGLGPPRRTILAHFYRSRQQNP